jgi:hypothetical protein
MRKPMNKKEQNRVQGYLDTADYEKFEKKCESVKRPISFVVRDLIRKWIK